jgi:hypothetical protein
MTTLEQRLRKMGFKVTPRKYNGYTYVTSGENRRTWPSTGQVVEGATRPSRLHINISPLLLED